MRYSPSEPLVSFSLPSVGHQPLDILDFLLAWGCVPLDLRVFDGEGGGGRPLRSAEDAKKVIDWLHHLRDESWLGHLAPVTVD